MQKRRNVHGETGGEEGKHFVELSATRSGFEMRRFSTLPCGEIGLRRLNKYSFLTRATIESNISEFSLLLVILRRGEGMRMIEGWKGI